jgi:hypothetical protein
MNTELSLSSHPSHHRLTRLCVTPAAVALLQVYALYQASLFFTSIGGAYSLDSSSMTASMYDSLRK